MQRVYVVAGLSTVAKVCDVVYGLKFDKSTAEAWDMSKDVRSKFCCMQRFVAREASSHQLR